MADQGERTEALMPPDMRLRTRNLPGLSLTVVLYVAGGLVSFLAL